MKRDAFYEYIGKLFIIQISQKLDISMQQAAELKNKRNNVKVSVDKLLDLIQEIESIKPAAPSED